MYASPETQKAATTLENSSANNASSTLQLPDFQLRPSFSFPTVSPPSSPLVVLLPSFMFRMVSLPRGKVLVVAFVLVGLTISFSLLNDFESSSQ